MTAELKTDVNHQDWMEQMEELNGHAESIAGQLDLLNQNISGLTLVFAAINEQLKNLNEKPSKKTPSKKTPNKKV